MPDAEGQPQAPEPAGDDAPVVTEFGDYTYVAKLAENSKVRSRNPGKDGLHRTEWYQIYEKADEQWPDGNPVKRYNQATLAWGDGTPVKKGADADVIAQAFKELIGCTLLPDDPAAKAYVGSHFRMKDVETSFSVNRAKGDPSAKHFYLRVPVEFLGQDYKYEGQVRTLQPRGDGQAAPSQDPVDNSAADAVTAQTVAKLLVGLPTAMPNHEWAGPIGQDESLRDVDQLFGENLRGGLTAGTIVPLLIEKGILVDNDGTLELAKEEVSG